MLLDAVELLRKHKNIDFAFTSIEYTDFPFARLETRVEGPTIAQGHKFADGSDHWDFNDHHFAADKAFWLDKYVDYKNLSGDQKVIARLASLMYYK